MGPEKLRIGLGFLGVSTSLAALSIASPALAQGFSAGTLLGAAPLAVALGAGAFGLIAIALIRRLYRDKRAAAAESAGQIAGLRASLDEYEALLSSAREVVVLWTDRAAGPRFFGQTSLLLPPGRRSEAVLDFATWLTDAAADEIARALEALKVDGRSFETTLASRDGRSINAAGWLLGGGTVLRLRVTTERPAREPAAAVPAPRKPDDLAMARTVLGSLGRPAFLRDGGGRLVFANAAYHDLARAIGRRSTEAVPADLVGQKPASALGGRQISTSVTLGEAGSFELVEFPLDGGSAGYLQPRREPAAREAGLGHLSAIINALATPIAIFGADRGLQQANQAYIELWGLDPNWLKLGMDEREILDKLRTEGKLPAEPDYQAWRTRHLSSYTLKAPRELDPWYLPDGRAVQVMAAPAGPGGGVIYVFEDITAQLALKSQHKAMLDVQRSTLNALSEAVAVFGTNGRLTLSNPRLSTLWKLPTNLLDSSPHIDQIAEAAGRALPEDGASVWRGLKREVIDLNAQRQDRQGRLTRADGKLIDYAVTRLPDGQTMMTFLDVTESAKYQQVLKERNLALEAADRLKDAFVQNVSYELRSPLTNIIGFAELLATGAAGELNDKQRSYTGYIRAASETLGVLIDSILDLATVDAGVAELRPEPQDVRALVEKARAGLASAFPEIDGKRTLNLKVEMADGLPSLYADGTRIVQVLYNLLSNAARFSEPGGEVRLGVSQRGGRMLFVVEDEGAAVSDEMRAAMASGNSTTGRQRGAGLGLSVVRAFVNLHGGTIQIERREPRGNRVTVSLPIAAAVAGAAE